MDISNFSHNPNPNLYVNSNNVVLSNGSNDKVQNMKNYLLNNNNGNQTQNAPKP